MKQELSTVFNSRQYMKSGDFEIFYYHDASLHHISFHQHPYYEFYFFLEGDVEYQIDSSSYPLHYGDFLLIPPGIPHRPVFHSQDVPYRRFVLWLSIDFYNSLKLVSPDFSYGFSFAKNQQRYYFQTDFISSQSIQGQLMTILEEKHGRKTFHSIQASILAASFLIQINRFIYDKVHQVLPSYDHVLYLNVCDYINNHLGDDLSLDTLSAFFYLSKYHIAHIFKDHMGISLHQYIIKKRLQASKNGILSGLPLNQIMDQYGFHDYTSFYRAFKKEFGLSPTKYRKQYQIPPVSPMPF